MNPRSHSLRPFVGIALALILAGGGLAVDSHLAGRPAAAQGTLILSDDFSKKDSGWSEYTDEDATRQYNGGEYVVTVKAAKAYAAFGIHNLIIRDMDLSVKFRFITPADVANGFAMFVWRYFATDTDNGYYTLYLDPYSTPNVCRIDRYQASRGVVTLLQTPCEGIFKTKSDEWNKLQVIARGADMTFMVNDVKVIELRDRFLREGVIGLGAVNRGNATGMKVAWDDIKVYVPEPAPTWTNTPRPTPTEVPEQPTEEPTATTLPSPTPRPTRAPTNTATDVPPTRTAGPTVAPPAGKVFLPSLFRNHAMGGVMLSYDRYSPRSAMYSATRSGTW